MTLSEYDMMTAVLDELFSQYNYSVKYTGEVKEEIQPILISHMYQYTEQMKDICLNLTKLS